MERGDQQLSKNVSLIGSWKNYTERAKSLFQANQNLIFQNELPVKNTWLIESIITSVCINKME